MKSPGQSQRNLENLASFALKRLYLASEDIQGRLASKGYSGPEVWLKRGSAGPLGALQILAFVVATALTILLLVA